MKCPEEIHIINFSFQRKLSKIDLPPDTHPGAPNLIAHKEN